MAHQGLKTTVIGSFPKPDYLELPDWFRKDPARASVEAFSQHLQVVQQDDEERKRLQELTSRALRDIVSHQVECGVDVVTDGEVYRENYIYHIARHIDGISFDTLTKRVMRNGAYEAFVPTVVGQVKWKGDLDVGAEWKAAQDVTNHTVKYTLPGPMTIIGSTFNRHYENNDAGLAADLAAIINRLALQLVAAGCKAIQIDEPLFAREPERAKAWGIGLLSQCLQGVPSSVHRTVHICCGYPNKLDDKDYLKADRGVYLELAPLLDDLDCIDAVSLEDAHRHNDLSKLLPLFQRKQVVLGVVKIASSQVESVEEIQARIEEALRFVPRERLVVAPDCGLGFLPRDLLTTKLTNMCKAAKAV